MTDVNIPPVQYLAVDCRTRDMLVANVESFLDSLGVYSRGHLDYNEWRG